MNFEKYKARRERENTKRRAVRKAEREDGLSWSQIVVVALKYGKGVNGMGAGWRREGGPVVHQMGGKL